MVAPILAVNNIDASAAFYQSALGFKHNWSIPDANGKTDFASVQLGEHEILLGVTQGFVESGDMDKRGTGVVLYLELPKDGDLKVDAIYALAQAAAATITRPIGDRPWGERTFNVKDPDGYTLLIAQPIAKSDQGSAT